MYPNCHELVGEKRGAREKNRGKIGEIKGDKRGAAVASREGVIERFQRWAEK